MAIHLVTALENLQISVLELAKLVEDQVWKSMESFKNRDQELAEQVMSFDKKVDIMEIDIEEECLKILALYQPVAQDLRNVISVLKINNDLERIGDLAANIASRAKSLAVHSLPEVDIDFTFMAEQVVKMLQDSLESFAKSDIELAKAVCDKDLIIDAIHKKNFAIVSDAILAHPGFAAHMIALSSVSRYLERIGDLATNIAEDAIYLVDGKIVRHSNEDSKIEEMDT